MSQLFPVSWSLPIPATILCSCAAPDMSHYQTLFSVQSFQDFKIVANFHKLCNIWFAVINTKEKLQWTWKHKITGPALTLDSHLSQATQCVFSALAFSCGQLTALLPETFGFVFDVSWVIYMSQTKLGVDCQGVIKQQPSSLGWI